MKKIKIKKRILSMIISAVFVCNLSIGVNSSAVETYRSYRHGLGDVVEDGSLKSNDMLMLKKYLLGQVDLSATQLKTANIQFSAGDGAKINSADLSLLKKCLLNNCGYPENSISSLHRAISNSDNIVLKNMRDVIGEFMYEYSRKDWQYTQPTSRTYTINGQEFTGCRTDCSTAVSLALYMSGVLNETKLNINKLPRYLTTDQIIDNFDAISNCVNSGYSLNLLKLNKGSTLIQPGDILIYKGHTSVVVSCIQSMDMPTDLTYGKYSNVAVYGAGGDFGDVHKHRLSPEIETIGTDRPYQYIIRVSRV